MELLNGDQEKFLKLTSFTTQTLYRTLADLVQQGWEHKFPNTLLVNSPQKEDFQSLAVEIDPSNPEKIKVIAEIRQSYSRMNLNDGSLIENPITANMKAEYDFYSDTATYSPLTFEGLAPL